MKKALITGISGQDGSYLAEFLLEKGYQVHGLVMPEEINNKEKRLNNIANVMNNVSLHPVMITNFQEVNEIMAAVQPDECYHLAAKSFVDMDFNSDLSVFEVNVSSTNNVLAAVRTSAPSCRTYFAGTSEMFGDALSAPQDENSSFHPRSIYGISKLAGYHLAENYKKQFGQFVCSGILYNHESERRGFEYVTRKITSTAARIKLGLTDTLELGNLNARRDWGYSPEYIQAMWLMLQQNQPDNYVIGSGQTHSVKEFVQAAFEVLDLDWREWVRINPEYIRPEEKVELRANPYKAVNTLGWQAKTDYRTIARKMVLNDLELLKNNTNVK